VWTTEPELSRLATGELRATAGDVATVAVDEADADAFDVETAYRLVTLPAEPRADREFASLLRTADETMGAVTLEEGSPLVGQPLSTVGETVAAIRPAGGTVETVEAIPRRSRETAVGDTLYVVARPDALRRLEAKAQAQPSSMPAGE
jgi:Trk K+ transport system NAD-binding subunit